MAKKVNLQQIDMGVLIGILKNNIGVVLGVLLLGLFVAEGFMIKSSVGILTDNNTVADPSALKAAVRVNFKDYDAAIGRIQSAGSYVASTAPAVVSPFGIPHSSTP